MSENDIQAGNTTEAAQQSHAMQVNIKMQQGEHTGQPIYSNFTAVQGGQGVILVDFGFLDPQTINTINRMAKSGEKTQTVNARMSRRMAISIDAASQLTRQLNQLLHGNRQAGEQLQAGQQNEAKVEEVTSGVETTAEEKLKSKKGIRFPWSSGD